MANYNKGKKYHFIYKTTNLINGKYYIGMHSTNNLKDGYLGSGKKLRRSINKYGVENFKCEILEFQTDRDLLAKREKEIVNEELLKDPMCMNLKEGGTGGFTAENAMLGRIAANLKLMEKYGENFLSEMNKQYHMKLTEEEKRHRNLKIKQGLKEVNFNHATFKGKLHSEETKKKMSKSSKGAGIKENNSQFGTCWITNGIEIKKIKKENLEFFLNLGWKRGRILK